MLNNIIYTGTGIALASLSAVYYYVYSSRINANAKEVHPDLAVDPSSEEEGDTVFEGCVSEATAADGSSSDPTQFNSFSLPEEKTSSSSPPTPFVSFRESTSDESFGPIAPPKIHSTPRLAASLYLRASLQSLITGNGSKHGLNIANEKANDEISALIPRTQSRSRNDSGFFYEMRQIVSRTELTSPVSFIVYEEIPEDPENATGGDHNGNAREGDVKTSGVKSLVRKDYESLVSPSVETSTCASQTDVDEMKESLTPLHRTESSIVFYTNPRFGERYACKDSERLTLPAILKNSAMQPQVNSIPGPSSKNPNRIIAKKRHALKFDRPVNRLSASESFQQILQRKRKHLRPVGERKSEGKIPEFQRDASAQTNAPEADTIDLGHTDSTLFLFPPVLSESRMSIEENDSEQATDGQIQKAAVGNSAPTERAECMKEARAGTNEFDVNNNDGPGRQGPSVPTDKVRVRKRKRPEEETPAPASVALAPVADAETSETFLNSTADNNPVVLNPALTLPSPLDQSAGAAHSTSWALLFIILVLGLVVYFVVTPLFLSSPDRVRKYSKIAGGKVGEQ